MLTVIGYVLMVIAFVLIVPTMLIGIIFTIIKYLIIIPFEYPKYKNSKYYKKHKQKYFAGITLLELYKIINYLEKENINYDYFDIEKGELIIGNTTYLLPWFQWIWLDNEGNCYISYEDYYEDDEEPPLLLEDLKSKNKENIKVLIKRGNVMNSGLKESDNNEILIMYDKLSDLRKYLK